MGFSRQEYWDGLPCPPLEGLPDAVIKPVPLMSLPSADGFFTTSITQVPPKRFLQLWVQKNEAGPPALRSEPDDRDKGGSATGRVVAAPSAFTPPQMLQLSPRKWNEGWTGGPGEETGRRAEDLPSLGLRVFICPGKTGEGLNQELEGSLVCAS